MDYSHLNAPIAHTRHVLAMHYLEHWVDDVIDIGGGDVLWEYIDTRFDNVLVVDPSIKEEEITNGDYGYYQSIACPFQEYDFDAWIDEVYEDCNHRDIGLVMLGVELIATDEELEAIKRIIKDCKMAIFDHVIMNPTASEQVSKFKKWCLGSGLTLHQELRLSFLTDDQYSEPNASFYKERVLQVWKK